MYSFPGGESWELVKKTGMDFADAFAQVKGKLGGESMGAKRASAGAKRSPLQSLAGSWPSASEQDTEFLKLGDRFVARSGQIPSGARRSLWSRLDCSSRWRNGLSSLP